MELQDWIVGIDEKVIRPTENIPEEVGVPQNRKKAIFRLPSDFHSKHSLACKPNMVSFGPYYKGVDSCKTTVQEKEGALLQVLSKTGNSVRHYVQALAEVVEDLKDAYDQLDPYWQQNTDAFLMLMILDGCFLLWILYKHYAFLCDDEDARDMGCYRHDVSLVENQLPMLVLVKICAEIEHVDEREAEWSVNNLIISFLYDAHVLMQIKSGRYLHVLDLYQNCLLNQGFRGKSMKRRTKRNKTGRHINIPSATQLLDAGIEITRSKTTSVRHITFEHRTLTLPIIIVNATTDTMFLNVMAFEQAHKAKSEVTSCVWLMHSLLKGANDVNLLQSRGILNHTLPSDEDVAELFSMLFEDVRLVPDNLIHYEFHQLAFKVRKQFNTMSTPWGQDLFKTYLRSPFAIVSVIAAILLFTLTIIQTVYTVLSYVNRNN